MGIPPGYHLYLRGDKAHTMSSLQNKQLNKDLGCDGQTYETQVDGRRRRRRHQAAPAPRQQRPPHRQAPLHGDEQRHLAGVGVIQ